MRSADDIAVQFAPQNPGIAPLHPLRHGAANIRKRLVPVQADQLDALAVEHETVGSVARLAEPDPGVVFVLPAAGRRQPHHHAVQLRLLQIPKFDIGERLELNLMKLRCPGHLRGRRLQYRRAVPQFRGERGRAADRTLQIAAHHNRPLRRQRRHRLGIDVFDKGLRHYAKLHAAVDAAEGQVVDVLTERRDVFALGRIQRHRDHIVSAVFQVRRDLETEGCVAALVLVELVPIHGYRGCGHRTAEIEEDALALPFRQPTKVAPVSGDVLKACLIETVPRQTDVGVWQSDLLPRRIVELRGRNPGRRLAAEQPAAIQFVDAPLWIRLCRRVLHLRLQDARCRRAKNEQAPTDLWLLAHIGAVR